MTRTYNNLQEALPIELYNLINNGTRVTTRNGPAQEVLARTITLKRPHERFQTLLYRRANPIAQVAETLWVLAGRNDVEWLSYYLPRAKDFSDDGLTWRAGYGPRLRNWGREGDVKVDQVFEALSLLSEDPLTRRAVISLWDPGQDWLHSKDIPCNNWLQFQVRDHRLHMNVVVRSNDIIWGWSGINTFEWSFLQEVMAHSLNVEVGEATYFIGNFHLYEHHVERAKNIIGSYRAFAKGMYTPYTAKASQPSLNLTLTLLDRWLDGEFWTTEANIRKDPDAIHHLSTFERHPTRSDIYRMLDVYARVQDNQMTALELKERAGEIEHTDMRLATEEWLSHQKLPTRKVLQVARAWPTVFELVPALQAEKNRLYGGSWKRYGEVASIFPNIARKFDRLNTIQGLDSFHSEETVLDTVVDLAVYATMYLGWLNPNVADGEEFTEGFNQVFDVCAAQEFRDIHLWAHIKEAFYGLAQLLEIPEVRQPTILYQTKADAALDLAKYAFAWAQRIRVENEAEWAKFVEYVNTFTRRTA